MINRFILSMDGKVYSFLEMRPIDPTTYIDSSFYWFTRRGGLGVYIPYFESIYEANKHYKVLLPPPAKVTLIMGNIRYDNFRLQEIQFKNMSNGGTPFVSLHLVNSA